MLVCGNEHCSSTSELAAIAEGKIGPKTQIMNHRGYFTTEWVWNGRQLGCEIPLEYRACDLVDILAFTHADSNAAQYSHPWVLLAQYTIQYPLDGPQHCLYLQPQWLVYRVSTWKICGRMLNWRLVTNGLKPGTIGTVMPASTFIYKREFAVVEEQLGHNVHLALDFPLRCSISIFNEGASKCFRIACNR